MNSRFKIIQLTGSPTKLGNLVKLFFAKFMHQFHHFAVGVIHGVHFTFVLVVPVTVGQTRFKWLEEAHE